MYVLLIYSPNNIGKRYPKLIMKAIRAPRESIEPREIINVSKSKLNVYTQSNPSLIRTLSAIGFHALATDLG